MGGSTLVPNVAWFRPHLERMGAAAAKSRVPGIGYDRQFAESGGLLSYGPTPLQNAPRLAAQIDKILKGAKPADLLVEQPTRGRTPTFSPPSAVAKRAPARSCRGGLSHPYYPQ